MKRFLVLGALLWCGTSLMADEDSYKAYIGKPVGELKFEQMLQAPEGEAGDLEKLKGKVVVLELWATWCGPCVRAFPHLNELSNHFKGKPVQFISITDEDKTRVEKFLKLHKLKSWVGIDKDKSLWKHFKFKSIPRTIILDAKGNVAAVTNPAYLKIKHIEMVLAGKPVKIEAPKPLTVVAGIDPLTGKAVEGAVIRDTKYPDNALSFKRSADGTKYTLINYELKHIFRWMYGIEDTHRVTDFEIVNRKIDLILNVKAGKKTEALNEAFGKLLNCKVFIGLRDLEVLIIKPGKHSSQRVGRSFPLTYLTRLFERDTGKVVIDESGLKAVNLPGAPKKGYIPDTKNKFEKQQILSFVPAKRKVTVLIFSSLEKGKK